MHDYHVEKCRPVNIFDVIIDLIFKVLKPRIDEVSD